MPDAFLDAGALPTLHDRYGISTAAMVATLKQWLKFQASAAGLGKRDDSRIIETWR